MTEQRIRSEMQLCIACNKLVRLDVSSCKCGHVLREALTFKEDQTSRKRRATYRPNSVSSEWISIKEKLELKMALKKSKLENLNNIQKTNEAFTLGKIDEQTKSDNNNNNVPRPVGRPKQKQKHGNSGRKKLAKLNNNHSNNCCVENVAPSTTDDAQQQQQKKELEKQNKLKEIAAAMMESASYQNIYFHRCKSYKKAKPSDLDFEFDFSLFDTHHPFYPSALEDINTKINRTNSFWKSVL